MDAEVWADEWLKVLAEHPGIPQDRGCMIGWFANAVMAGRMKPSAGPRSTKKPYPFEYA